MSSEPNRKRLTRSHDHKLGGVAGGVADYFDLDPTIVRIVWVVALFVGPFGAAAALTYLLMWIILPRPEGPPPAPSTVSSASTGGTDATTILGVILVVLGALFLLRSSWLWMPGFAIAGFATFWPVVLILVGAFVIYASKR